MHNTTEVVIGGEIITLRSAEEPMYMQKLARYVDQKMTELKKKSVSAAIDDKARTVIYALNIADDYVKTNEKLTRLESVHKRFVVDNGNLQKENGILSARVKALEAELARTKAMEAELVRLRAENDELLKTLESGTGKPEAPSSEAPKIEPPKTEPPKTEPPQKDPNPETDNTQSRNQKTRERRLQNDGQTSSTSQAHGRTGH